MKKEKNNDLKIQIKGLISLLILSTILFFRGIPFQILGIDINSIKESVIYIYSIITQIIGVIIIFIIYKDYVLKCWNDVKKKKNKYLKKYIKYWFIILAGTATLNFIIMMLNGGNMAANEESVRSTLTAAPIYMWISAVIVAPFFEELMFRLSLKSIFKNKWLFIAISGFMFGLAHVISTVTNFYSILYILPYSLPGFIFAYILDDSDNIFVPIGMHMLHNGVAMALQIFIMIFGGAM